MNISFFITTFSSIVWIFYCSRIISSQTIISNGIASLYQTIAIYTLPLLTIWIVFALIKMFYSEKHREDNIYTLINHIKNNTNNQQNNELQKELKNNFALQEFNILLSDTNEILSDIIKRSNSISTAQIENLLTRAFNGERWLLAKTFIEIDSFQHDFTKNLIQKARKNNLLKGSILEFNQRYKDLHTLLDVFDKQKLFFNMIEYGPLGRVYSILAPVIDTINNSQPVKETTTIDYTNSIATQNLNEQNSFPAFLSQKEDDFTMTENKENKIAKQNINDSLTAIKEELISSQEDEEIMPAPSVANFGHTNAALRSIKQEKQPKNTEQQKTAKNQKIISLEELEKEINASPENNYDEFAYPFGDWKNDKISN